MALASSSHIEETIEDHDEEEGPIPISKLEVKLITNNIIINLIH